MMTKATKDSDPRVDLAKMIQSNLLQGAIQQLGFISTITWLIQIPHDILCLVLTEWRELRLVHQSLYPPICGECVVSQLHSKSYKTCVIPKRGLRVSKNPLWGIMLLHAIIIQLDTMMQFGYCRTLEQWIVKVHRVIKIVLTNPKIQ